MARNKKTTVQAITKLEVTELLSLDPGQSLSGPSTHFQGPEVALMPSCARLCLSGQARGCVDSKTVFGVSHVAQSVFTL